MALNMPQPLPIAVRGRQAAPPVAGVEPQDSTGVAGEDVRARVTVEVAGRDDRERRPPAAQPAAGVEEEDPLPG